MARDSVASVSLEILHEAAVIVFGSMIWSPTFRRLACHGLQGQRVNRLKAGLKPGDSDCRATLLNLFQDNPYAGACLTEQGIGQVRMVQQRRRRSIMVFLC